MLGRAASNGVSPLPVNDMEEVSVRATAALSNTTERVSE